MNFTIYCRELRGGGARAVGVGLLTSLARECHGHSITAYVPEDPEFATVIGDAIKIIPTPTKGGRHHLRAQREFRNELNANRPDALFMMGNLGLVGAPCPQAVLLHNPWLLYPNSEAWRKCTPRDFIYRRIRNYFMIRGVRHSEVVAAQTPVMLERVHRLLGIPYERLALIPNSITSSGESAESLTESSRKMQSTSHRFRAICLSRYYTHKNIEILLEVTDRLLAANRTDIGLFITLDPSHGNGARHIINELKKNRRGLILHNLGQIPMSHVASCYRVADALLLPTLLESFTNTYIDAMGFGVPIITSDMDFARTVCGDAALYIDPLDSSIIITALSTLELDETGWQQRISIGRERCETLFMDWDTIARRVISMLECTATKSSVSHLLTDRWVTENPEIVPNLAHV